MKKLKSGFIHSEILAVISVIVVVGAVVFVVNKNLSTSSIPTTIPEPIVEVNKYENDDRNTEPIDYSHIRQKINFLIDPPPQWASSVKLIDLDETMILQKDSPHQKKGFRGLEVYIGSSFVYSTSSGICANQWCEDEMPFGVTIEGKKYLARVVKASIGDEKTFERYSFRIYLDEDQTYPAITGSYFTEEEKQEIIKMLETLDLNAS